MNMDHDQSDPNEQQHAAAAGGESSHEMGAYGPNNSQLPYPTAPVQTQTGFSNQQLAYQQHQHQAQEQHQQLQAFWANQKQEIEQTEDFKNHSLPLARIKKIMKSDEDVRMISAEAPVVFAKACEMFIQELTLQSWLHTEENKRRTLQKNDISAAISRTDVFDFLVDIIPRDEPKEEGLGVTSKATVPMADSAGPYYYVHPSQPQQQQQQPPEGPPGMIIGGTPVVDQGTAIYGGHPVAFMPWNPAAGQHQQHQHHEADQH